MKRYKTILNERQIASFEKAKLEGFKAQIVCCAIKCDKCPATKCLSQDSTITDKQLIAWAQEEI